MKSVILRQRIFVVMLWALLMLPIAEAHAFEQPSALQVQSSGALVEPDPYSTSYHAHWQEEASLSWEDFQAPVPVYAGLWGGLTQGMMNMLHPNEGGGVGWMTELHGKPIRRPEARTIRKPDNLELNSVPVLAPSAEQVITTMKVTATGYTAGFESTGKRPNHPQYGITYSGVKVTRDKNTLSTIAADPRTFPLGSILYIPGYGYGIVADTGSAIKGRKIDLYFATTKQVYEEWGKKDVEVQIIKRGGGRCTEQMMAEFKKAIQVHKMIPEAMLDESV